ncbi:MAG TPA: asparagine synthase C-terminal domain-containing protein, partial [Planctomycetota bacterium]|nr:asparagine synthase C-terminal domain-containing protein [Planctomycetota bacterium]
LARRAFGAAASRWPRGPRVPRALRLGTLLDNLAVEPAEAYFRDLCFLKPETALRLLGRAPAPARELRAFEAVTAPYRRCPSRDPVQKAEYADLRVYLADDVLVKVDRMSMLHGLEVRCPLLDHELVELAFALPARAKMPRLRPKALLRRVAARYVPRAVLGLPKRGFSVPLASWLRGPLAGWFEAEVLGADAHVRGRLDARFLRQLWDEHRSGARDRSYALWAVWMLERWHRVCERPRAADRPRARSFAEAAAC